LVGNTNLLKGRHQLSNYWSWRKGQLCWTSCLSWYAWATLIPRGAYFYFLEPRRF